MPAVREGRGSAGDEALAISPPSPPPASPAWRCDFGVAGSVSALCKENVIESINRVLYYGPASATAAAPGSGGLGAGAGGPAAGARRPLVAEAGRGGCSRFRRAAACDATAHGPAPPRRGGRPAPPCRERRGRGRGRPRGRAAPRCPAPPAPPPRSSWPGGPSRRGPVSPSSTSASPAAPPPT